MTSGVVSADASSKKRCNNDFQVRLSRYILKVVRAELIIINN